MRPAKKSLSLEVLEARALFAGLALPIPEFDLVVQAIDASGPIDASFDPKIPNRLVLHGSANVDLTINFDKLPATVTSIDISDFDSVRFEGKDVLYNLYVTDVRALEAPQIDIWGGGFIASNVDKFSLNSVHGDLLLAGDKVDAKINDLGGTSVVLKLNALVLETQSKSLNLVSMINDRMVIALPVTPASWDPLDPKSWKGLSGFDNISSQIRLGTRNVAIEASSPGSHEPTTPAEPGIPGTSVTPVDPDSGGQGNNDSQSPEPTHPGIPPLSVEVDLRSYLDRLEVLFNKVGGFEATGLDIGTVTRVVAELRHTQADGHAGVSNELPIPESMRRNLLVDSGAAHLDTHAILPVAEAKAPVAVNVENLGNDPAQAESLAHTNLPRSEAPHILNNGPLILSEGMRGDPQASHGVHVTVDPDAPAEAPKFNLFNVISLFMDRAVNLKSYVIDQLSQEIVPGERTGVLLVDPKSVRASQQNKLTS
ncbi:MAG: hypothetical protein KBA71_03935 [Opitutaceae bacterium]|nr:hypothetical protein [Opitutaceae bacterium]